MDNEREKLIERFRELILDKLRGLLLFQAKRRNLGVRENALLLPHTACMQCTQNKFIMYVCAENTR